MLLSISIYSLKHDHIKTFQSSDYDNEAKLSNAVKDYCKSNARCYEIIYVYSDGHIDREDVSDVYDI